MDLPTQQPQPMGSPILAYAESRTPRLTRNILALIAGIFVFICILIGIVLFQPIRLPERTFLIAAIRGKTTLPAGSPLLWTAAASSPLPSVLGYAMTDHGPEAFTVTLGKLPTSQHAERSGLLTLTSDVALSQQSSDRWSSVAAVLPKLVRAPAYLRLIPSVFAPTLEGTIDGPIDHGIWRTNIRISETAASDLPHGDAAIDLRAFPEAWTPVKRALSASRFDFDEIDPPSSVSWSAATGTPTSIELFYDGATPTSTILNLATQLGLYDSQTISLPDQEVAQELTPPTSLFTASSSRRLETDLGSLELLDTGLRLVPTGTTALQDSSTFGCGSGHTVASIGSPLLQNIFQQTGLSFFLTPQRMTAAVDHQQLLFCLF